MANAKIIRIAADTRNKLAQLRLTPFQAKLYSQNLLKSTGQNGLVTFDEDNIEEQVHNALLLIHLSLIERQTAPEGEWRDGIKRAGEILEWLSQKDLLPAGAPFHLLSAAAYQVAGYPALALGHLQNVSEEYAYSRILFSYIKGDFAEVLVQAGKYWEEQTDLEEDGVEIGDDISALSFNHIVMCIGVMCDFLRTGDDTRVARTLEKLDKLADNFLLSRDYFSWMLARLLAEISKEYVKTSLWSKIGALTQDAPQSTQDSLIEFAKASFLKKRSLVWPAQIVGINKLAESSSFVLCTPTGSGKTTIATLAAIQALNAENQTLGLEGLEPDNLVLYLVPSKALASEVEERLSQDLTGISPRSTVVTGLYGGTDWGPTDAWISRDQPTVLVCTFEKADALLRYLGVLFLSRVRLVIIPLRAPGAKPLSNYDFNQFIVLNSKLCA